MSIASHQPLLSGFVMAAGNGLDAALAGWRFCDRPERRIEFDRLKDVIMLLAAELLVFQPMSTIFGMVAITLSHPLPRPVLIATAGAWYSANLYAQFVMAPAALIWIKGMPPPRRGSGVLELAAFAATTVLVGECGYRRWAIQGIPLAGVFIPIFPLLVWASVRFPSAIAVTAGSVMGLFAFDAGLAGLGPFAEIAAVDRMVYLNVFMAITIATSLFLSAAMGDNRRFEAEQARLISELRDSSAHVERLKELITFCAWTGRVRWQGQWVSVEQFLKERYDVAVSHGISEEALSRFLTDPDQPSKQGPAAKLVGGDGRAQSYADLAPRGRIRPTVAAGGQGPHIARFFASGDMLVKAFSALAWVWW